MKPVAVLAALLMLAASGLASEETPSFTITKPVTDGPTSDFLNSPEKHALNDAKLERLSKGGVAYGAGRITDKDDKRQYAVTLDTVSAGVKPQEPMGTSVAAPVSGTITRVSNAIAEAVATAWVASDDSGLDYVAAKGDPEYKKYLDAEGMALEDSIDLDNGFQAVLLRDHLTGRKTIVIRGTEKTAGTWSEFIKDVKAGTYNGSTGDVAVGLQQYQAARPQLEKWVKANANNIVVTGHSLGGAIGQRLMLDYGQDVLYASFFNTPGLDQKTLMRLAQDPAVAKRLLDALGNRKTRIFNALNDPVSFFGRGFILADMIQASGKSIKEDPHLASVFGFDVSRKLTGYYGYLNIRNLGAEGWMSDFAATMSNSMQHLGDMDEVLWDILDSEHIALKDIEREGIDNTDQPEDPRARLADLLVQTGQPISGKRTTGKRPKEPRGPVAGQTIEIIQPEAEALAGIDGEFEGQFSWNAKNSRLENTHIYLSIEGTNVYGYAEGVVVNNQLSTMRDPFRLEITSGAYDPKDSSIRARLEGKVKMFGDWDVDITGTGGPEGFSGKSVRGSIQWSVSPKTVRTITLEEAICTKHPPEKWYLWRIESCPSKFTKDNPYMKK